MTIIISPSGQKNNEFSQWDITKKYRVGDLVIHNQKIYETTTEVPAGTPFDIADPNSPWFIAVVADTAQNAVNAQNADNAVNAQSADEALALDAPDTAAVKIGGGLLGEVLTSDGAGGTEWGPVVATSIDGANVAGQVADAASADEALAIDAPDTAAVKIGGGTAGQVLKSDGAGGTVWATDDAAPAGANTEVQFNDDGVFGAAPRFTYTLDTDTLSTFNLQVTNTVSSNLIPSSNVTYDLGSTTQRWNDLYLSNSTIYMDDQTISANAGNVVFSGNIIASELIGNATYANAAGTVPRDAVTGVTGRDGQLQFNTTSGNLTSNERYFIGANGGGALNISRDGASGTGVAIYAYSNQASIAATFVSRARGTKTAPLAAQVGDRVFSTGGQIYTGVGTATADTITGWSPLAQTPSMAAEITALPTSPSTTYGSKLTFSASNATTNSTRTMTFNDDGSLNVPGEIVAIGANLGDVGGVTIAGGTNGQVLSTDGAGNLTWATGGGGSTNPAGANTQVQFNDGGVFGADAAFTFDKATGLMSVQDLLVTGNVTGALLPDANITYDLGSTTQRWKDLYLSNTTIYMGDQTISANATQVNISNTVATDTLVAANLIGDLTRGTTVVAIDGDDGNINFTVDGIQQWAFGVNGALTAANTTAQILGTSDQTVSVRAGGLVLGTLDNLAADGTVSDFSLVGGNGGPGTTPGAGGQVIVQGGTGGAGGDYGADGGNVVIVSGTGGDGTVQPGSSGTVTVKTADGVSNGTTNQRSGAMTIGTGNASGDSTLPGSYGGWMNIVSGSGTTSDLDGGDGGQLELRPGAGGNGGTGDGGNAGRIRLVPSSAGSSTDGRGGRGGDILATASRGGASVNGDGGDGGAVTITAGSGGDSDAATAGLGGKLTLRSGGGADTVSGTASAGGDIELTTGRGGSASGGGIVADGGNLTVTLGDGGTGTTNDGGTGGSFTVTTGRGGLCDPGSTPGESGEIRMTTADALPSVGARGAPSGDVTIETGAGGESDTDRGGRSGTINITTGAGGNNQSDTANPGQAGDIVLATGDGGSVTDGTPSRAGARAGAVEIRGGNGGTGSAGGRGGDIDLITGAGGEGLSDTGSRGGDLTVETGRGGDSNGGQTGQGGSIEVTTGPGGDGVGGNPGGNAGTVTITTGDGGTGDGTGTDHEGGAPWGDAGRVSLRTGTGGEATQGEAGYGGDILIETGDGGACGSGGAGAAGHAGNFTITLGAGGESSDGPGGDGGSFHVTAGNGGTGSSGNGDSGSITLTTEAGSFVFDPTGQFTLPSINSEQAAFKGTRTIVIGDSASLTPNTPTVVFSTLAKSLKMSFTITHTAPSNELETEFFDVVVARGFTDTLFSVSNRLNTFGSNGGANDTVVTVGINGTSNEIEVSLDTKIGTAASVAYSVTEFKN